MLKSASKVVFLMLTFAACIGFFIGKLDSKDFMYLAGLAQQPYAGK